MHALKISQLVTHIDIGINERGKAIFLNLKHDVNSRYCFICSDDFRCKREMALPLYFVCNRICHSSYTYVYDMTKLFLSY